MRGTILEKINKVPSARPAGTKQAAIPEEDLSSDPWCLLLSILFSCFFCSSFLFAHLQEYSASSLPVFEKVTADDSEDNKRVVGFFFFLSS